MFVVIAAVVCLLMGWWQWDRYESSSGTGQNLGYALQWPLFAVACVWGYRRFIQLEAEYAEEDAAIARAGAPDDSATSNGHAVDAAVASPAAHPARRDDALREIPVGFLPQRAATPATAGETDGTTEDYNRMLAELAAGDAHQEQQR